MENILQLFITFLGIVGAFYISKLANDKNKSFTDILGYLIILAILIWASSYTVDNYILDKDNKEFNRKYAFERSVDGYWLQEWKLDSIHNYSIIEINFNPSTLRLSIKGTSYTSEGKMFVNWNSKGTFINPVDNKILYSYSGEFKNKRLEGDGYSELNFSNNMLDGKFLNATGYFSDSFTEFKPSTFEIDRITDENCQKLIGKKNLQYSLDKVKYVQNYHKLKYGKKQQ